jgi:acetyltransferase-like isoleucine patch superfamily enzyme
MRDANHDPSAGRLSELHFEIAPIAIGANTWFGSKSTVVAGVTIGPDVVVAAGAVVTRDVDPTLRVGGIPARPLRTASGT